MRPAGRERLTEQEYLERERSADERHEYLRGEATAMAGGSPRHNLIAGNLAGLLRERLRGTPCIVFPSDQRIYVSATGLYTYPDVSVVCGRLEVHAGDTHSICNPRILAEVLSDSTEAYDRGAKFGHYRRLASLEDYLLVSQGEPRVEHYRRVDVGQWLLTELQGDAAVALPGLAVELPLNEIYAKVEQLETGES